MGMLSFFKRSQPVETKSTLAAPEDWMWALFGAAAPSGSVGLSGAAALTVPAVSAAIRALAEAAMTLAIRVVETDEAGAETELPDHPITRLLAGEVNDWTSGPELIRDLLSEALIRDAGGMAWVNRVDGKPVEIIQYRSGVMSAEFAETGQPTFRINGRVVNAADVIHVRGPFAKSALNLATEAIGVASMLERHTGRLFKNGARPGGVIEVPGPLGDDGLKNMRTAWQAAHSGADNVGKTAILWSGAKFNSLTMSSTDAQFLELRKFQILEIARAFRVPPSMLFELDRATWSNSEQMGREFLTYSLEPWLQVLEAALGRALFSRDERGSLKLRFDRDDLTRADIGDRAIAYSSLISSRVINPNQARRWEGLAPYSGGEAYQNPNITASPAPEPAT
jgi:HK97 family phage portal protein